MIIDLTPILNNTKESLYLEAPIIFPKEYLDNTEIKDIKETNVRINVYKDTSQMVIFDIELDTIIVLSCARTLKPLDYPLNLKFNTNLDEILTEFAENYKKSENTLDISATLWQNIVVEVPLRVVDAQSDDKNVYGDGWKVLYNPLEDQTVDPRLAKLKDLL